MSEQKTIVKKGTEEFKLTCQKYLKLFFDSKEGEYIKKGEFTQGEHQGKFLGMTSKKILEAKLPMPFGCLDLFIQPCFDNAEGREPDQLNKLTGVIWFCDRAGCLCVCCREDFTGEKEQYPVSCPPPEGFESCTEDCDSCLDDLCPSNPSHEDFEDEDMEPDW